MTTTAIVTGAATGIGRAIAEALADQCDEVVITGRRSELLSMTAKQLGEHVRAVSFDASDPDAVHAALERLPGQVDVLVNNAGGNTDFDRQPPAEADLHALRDAWLANIDANLMSSVLVTAALERRLSSGARVINVSSIAARDGAGSYGAAKAAIEAWTFDLATWLGPRGITVNAVSPGLIENTEFFRGQLPDERRATLIAGTKIGRAGRASDVSSLVAYLVSPHARHMTSQVLHVNGGAHSGL